MNAIYGNEASLTETDRSFTVPLNSKQDVTFTSKDPFGFLDAKMSDDSTPVEFNGVFTSPKEARVAVVTYIANHPEKTKK